ncbi:hypothetical protein [Photorhabdus namnaonensis]|uniref:Uncharacterized protein n=1 Tax=Photorhabdus namnaonensis TaxID=1851568 RepID=A0A1B8YFJ1_9GAMM|nr:hypothetical protein [Photorhabdus namnaonensis]OCA53908.1 hypothetical protein Phpb_03012 [Photorhabdus namnaonensis]
MIKIQDTYSFEILCEDVRIMPVEMDWISVEVFGVSEEGLQRMINEFYCEDILKIIGEKDIVNYLEENGYSVIKREKE